MKIETLILSLCCVLSAAVAADNGGNTPLSRRHRASSSKQQRPIGKTAPNTRCPSCILTGGCWVDYAHVFYWYQDQPGGFEHQPLPPVEERMKPLLRSSIKIK